MPDFGTAAVDDPVVAVEETRVADELLHATLGTEFLRSAVNSLEAFQLRRATLPASDAR